MIVPLYIYPAADGTPEWAAWAATAEVAAAAQQHQDTAVIVVANPADGPGAAADPNYRRAISHLRAAGATVVGYVALGYGAIDTAAVHRAVRAWQRLYRGIEGIFFDEVPHSGPEEMNPEATARRAYLRDVLAATRALGFALLIGNPGVEVPADYFDPEMFDIVVVHEQRYWPPSPRQSRRSAALIYGENVWDESRFRALSARIGFLFVNDHTLDLTAVGAYPWNYLPTNLGRQLELLVAMP